MSDPESSSPIFSRNVLPQQKTFKMSKEGGHHEQSDCFDEELEEYLRTDPSHGLTDLEVEERLLTFGKNGNFYLLTA